MLSVGVYSRNDRSLLFLVRCTPQSFLIRSVHSLGGYENVCYLYERNKVITDLNKIRERTRFSIE